MKLEGKVALITGASRGIGAAAARRFAREGARVGVNHLPDPKMEGLARDLVGEITDDGGIAMAIPGDVSDRGQVEGMVAQIREEFGDTDILVTNAARGARKPWTEIDVDTWDEVFAVNARGAFLCARAVYEGMLRRGGGSIITVSSVEVHLGLAGNLAYVASKGAVIGFTRSLARNLGPDGIRVNSVMPGAIRTEQEMERDLDVEQRARECAQNQSIPRRGYADDLAGTFVYLASEDSEFVSGQVIAVDGGWVHR